MVDTVNYFVVNIFKVFCPELVCDWSARELIWRQRAGVCAPALPGGTT